MDRKQTKQLWLSKYPTSSKTKQHLQDMFYRRQQNNQLKLEPVPITAPPGTFQADLMFLPNYSGYNRSRDAILNIIDINTRYLYSYPIKNKQTRDAFQHFLQVEKPTIHRLDVDRGSEFLGDLPPLLKKHNIELRQHTSKTGTAIVERVNRTVRDLIERAAEMNNSYNWIDILPDLIYEYNHSPHSSLKIDGREIAPANITADQVDQLLDQRRAISAARIDQIRKAFPIGANVLRRRQKNQFEKGATPNWGDTIYKIIEYSRPISFIIESPAGTQIKARYDDLQVVEGPASAEPKPPSMPRPARPKLIRQRRVQQQERREGIDPANILTTPRQRRPPKIFDI
ncbi:MAG: hypothetical protein WDA28_12765 [Castellaniella sp.]